MVVLVADQDVEDGAAELLFEIDGVQIEQANGLDRLLVAIAVPIGLGIVGFGLWTTFFIAIAAYYYWPMTIILVLIGGFMGGGWGAVIGAYLSGIIGLVLAKFQESKF